MENRTMFLKKTWTLAPALLLLGALFACGAGAHAQWTFREKAA